MKMVLLAEGNSGKSFADAVLPSLNEHCVTVCETLSALENLDTQSLDAVIVCTSPEHLAERLDSILSRGDVLVFPALVELPDLEQCRTLRNLLVRERVFPVLPQLLAPHALALEKALSSDLVGEAVTVNCTRKLALPGSAAALAFEDILVACKLLGSVRDVFAQGGRGGGRDSLMLTLRMDCGTLASICGQTGVGGQDSLKYDYACRDGVVHYNSLHQPLVVHSDSRVCSYPGYDEGWAQSAASSLSLALADAADTGGGMQANVLLKALDAAEMVKASLAANMTAQMGGDAS